MADLLSAIAWDTAMKASGYYVAGHSPQGSTLYECEGKPSYRVSPWPPNSATSAWMARSKVKDARCLAVEGTVAPIDPLPEFGLERPDEYHSDTEWITKSMLAVFEASPLEFYYQYITGEMPRKRPTRQMKLGTICHAMLLEKKRIDEACIAYPYSCYTVGEKPRLKSDRAAEYDRKVAPLLAMREQDIPIIEKIIENAKASKFGELLRLHSDKAKFEEVIEEEVYGVKCRCRPDLHIVLSDQVIVPDLKFGAFKPDDFWRSARSFNYAMQQSHYSCILSKRYQLPIHWRFWAFEKVFPYRVAPRWYDERSAEISLEHHKRLLLELKKCRETGVWEDKYQGEGTLAPWELTKRGEPESTEESTDESDFDEGTEYESTNIEL